MLENIISVLTTAAMGTFYDENGKKVKVGSLVMVQMPTGTGKNYGILGNKKILKELGYKG